jgi:uncharacterized protein YndB with AHSA1/START domain
MRSGTPQLAGPCGPDPWYIEVSANDDPIEVVTRLSRKIIQPPELLVFTWRSEITGMQDTRVTVRLTEHSSHETEAEVTHELGTDGEARSHAGGWGQLLGRLQAYLEDP